MTQVVNFQASCRPYALHAFVNVVSGYAKSIHYLGSYFKCKDLFNGCQFIRFTVTIYQYQFIQDAVRAMTPLNSQRIVTVLLIALLAGCGGGGGGNTTLNDTPNAAVATQVADIAPSNTEDTVSVFVALDSSTAVSGVTGFFLSEDEQRAQSQQNFLTALQANAGHALQAATGSTCTTADLASRITQAHTPNSGNAVRIDLNACELDLLPKLKGVSGVHSDISMSTQGMVSSTLSKSTDAIKMSFDGIMAQPTLNARTEDGNGQIIAILDSGVEDRHPALGSSKVLNGACFSTASNGGHSFCPNGQNTDTSSTTAARSCVDTWSGSRAEAIQAGCGHGTSMASAASMRYTTSDNLVVNGIAPNAQILPVQVFNQTITSTGNKSISASAGDLLAAVEWVTAEAKRRRNANLTPIAAVNLSLGSGSYNEACDSNYVGSLFKTAFTNLRNQGVLPVVATGNGGTKNAIAFPACVSNTLSVSAAKLGYSGLSSYASFNTQTKLIALGGDVDGSGRYALPVLCIAAGSYDCWQEIAGTSPAAALTSGGVAALLSVKAGATLTEVETTLTTDIAALNLTGSSAMHLSVNDGSQTITKPALRLTANAYRLLGLTESGGTTSTNSSSSDPVITQTQICVFSKPNFLGGQACATQAYGPNANADSKDQFYRYAGKVGSIRITDVQTNTALGINKATVTIYTALSARSQSGSVNASTADTTRLTVFTNPTINMVRIETQ